MEKEAEADEYCNKILMVLAMFGELRFNELHRTLIKCNAEMSKPTLALHLDHLREKEIIRRDEEAKQRISYKLNLRKLKQLQKFKESTKELLRNEKEFKSMTLNQQTILTAYLLTVSELFYLKTKILDILEPKNKLQNYYSYHLVKAFYNINTTWLLDSCKESRENSKKTLRSIDEHIKFLTDTSRLLPKDTPTLPQSTQQRELS